MKYNGDKMKLREKEHENVTITIDIPKDLKERVDTLIACNKGLTESQIIANALEEYLLMGDMSH